MKNQHGIREHSIPYYLRQLELGQVQLLHDLVSENVSGREQPAPTTALLVGTWAGLELYLGIEDVLVCNLGGPGYQRGPDVGRSKHSTSELRTRVRGDFLLPRGYIIKGQRSGRRQRRAGRHIHYRGGAFLVHGLTGRRGGGGFGWNGTHDGCKGQVGSLYRDGIGTFPDRDIIT
jgi:hypothetical protein